MNILTVCSGLDFINFTRRATIEAIHKINPDLDVLMYNSILNIRKRKNLSNDIRFYQYHFWIFETLRKYRIFSIIEYIIRYPKWKVFFKKYDVIFFIDPNQYYLLPYLSKKHKLIYLLRDPSVLMDKRNYHQELPVVMRANAILAISENLCTYYFSKYYGFVPENVHLWSNSVDLKLWNYDYWKVFQLAKKRPVIGLSGNINYVIDIELLIFIAQKLPEFDIEIAGKLELNENEKLQMKALLANSNVRHLGFINYNEFPAIVINWSIGLVAAKPDHEYARYLNNNKQYQYMAMGKPFVTYNLNSNYAEFDDMVFIAKNKSDYIEQIKLAIKKSNDKKAISSGLNIANKQSADIRALNFMHIVTNI